MAEMEIKRVNFFDGQFLKEEEFIALDAYHLHMRRRWAFVMFDKSGVVQGTPSDLGLISPAPLTPLADKKVLVNAGMAVGKRSDLAEAKEIVLRNNTEVSLLDPQWGLLPGDTAIFTLHYQETPIAVPPSEGDVAGNTRIEENAVIKVHRNALPPPLPSGEPYVRLGDVNFNTMALDSTNRSVAFLNLGLVAPSAPVPAIILTPNSGVAAAPPVAVAVTSSGGLNLSAITNANVTITPSANITHNVTNQAPSSCTLTLTLAAGASSVASRTVTITVGALTASATFTVQPGLQVLGFTPVNEPAGNTNLVINGTGFAASQPATIQFAGGVVPVVVPGLNVTATTITIPMASIPDGAIAGSTDVTTGGSTASLPVTPPPKILAPFPAATIAPNGLLTVNGVRLQNSTHVLMLQGASTILDKSTFGGVGELINAGQIKFHVPFAPTGAYTLRITTTGGTIVYGGMPGTTIDVS